MKADLLGRRLIVPGRGRGGSVVTVASPGVYSGKSRPAVVVQAER